MPKYYKRHYIFPHRIINRDMFYSPDYTVLMLLDRMTTWSCNTTIALSEVIEV